MDNMQHKRDFQECPPASKGEDKRERILDSALSLFAAQGITGTTVARIAEASGVTSAMVHYYFANREGLLDSLVAERLAPALRYIWAGVSSETLTDIKLVVTEFVDRLLEVVERMPQLPPLWSREILNAGGLLRGRLMPLIPQDKFEMARRSFADAQQDGKLNTGIAPGLVLTSIMSLVMLPLAARTILDKISVSSTLDKVMLREHVLALMLNGLRPADDSGGRQ